MTEALVDRIVDVFQGNVPKELIIFLVSMLPVLELRGGMIAAKLLGVPLLKAFVICYIAISCRYRLSCSLSVRSSNSSSVSAAQGR